MAVVLAFRGEVYIGSSTWINARIIGRIIGVVSGREIHCHRTFATVACSMIFRATVVVATAHGFF
jgi:hypothetical protein